MTLEEKLQEIIEMTEKLIEREDMLKHMGDSKQLEILKEKLALAKALELAVSEIKFIEVWGRKPKSIILSKIIREIDIVLNGE